MANEYIAVNVKTNSASYRDAPIALDNGFMKPGPGSCFLVSDATDVPATQFSAGTAGQFAIDGSTLWVCYEPNTWRSYPIT